MENLDQLHEVYTKYFDKFTHPSLFNRLNFLYSLAKFKLYSSYNLNIPANPTAEFINQLISSQKDNILSFKKLMLSVSRYSKTSHGRLLNLDLPMSISDLNFGVVQNWADPKDFIVSKENNTLWRSFCEKIKLPEFVKIPLLGVTRLYSKNTYFYPDDISDHKAEARQIFIHTLWDRIKGTIYDARSNFFRKAQTEKDCYRNDLAIIDDGTENSNLFSSHWVGHASCMLDIPVATEADNLNSKIRILTDPVEGDLNALFYKRRTRPGSLIEDLPGIDIVLISHDHRDHVDESTLTKLIPQQPLMLVPKGTTPFFQRMGFKHVTEILPGQTVDIVKKDRALLSISGVKAKHWTGRGLHDSHASAFLSFVISSKKLKNGDIYFAGDTALLDNNDADVIATRFNVGYSFQPGGPDMDREKMKSTHQSSADGLLMHVLFLAAALKKRGATSENLLPDLIKTIYMHTKTFKLGNLHHDDTDLSVARIIAALYAIDDYTWPNDGELVKITSKASQHIFIANLESYEMSVLDKILRIIKDVTVLDCDDQVKNFTPELLASVFEKSVRIPKIGETTNLDQTKLDIGLLDNALIINLKALRDCVNVFSSKGSLLEHTKRLLSNYNNKMWHPWSRSHTMEVHRAIESLSNDNLESSLDTLAQLNFDKSGHLSAYINYISQSVNNESNAKSANSTSISAAAPHLKCN